MRTSRYAVAGLPVLPALWLGGIATGAVLVVAACSSMSDRDSGNSDAMRTERATSARADDNAVLDEGKQTFRYDTFGSEDFWGGQLGLHKAIQGAKLGGVGDGVSPNTALKLGLKVDMDSVPAALAVTGGTLNVALGGVLNLTSCCCPRMIGDSVRQRGVISGVVPYRHDQAALGVI